MNLIFRLDPLPRIYHYLYANIPKPKSEILPVPSASDKRCLITYLHSELKSLIRNNMTLTGKTMKEQYAVHVFCFRY